MNLDKIKLLGKLGASSSALEIEGPEKSTNGNNLRKEGRRWCPEDDASPMSQLLFGWIDSLIALGQRKTLQMEDLWDISRRDDAQKVASRFAYFYSTTNDATAPNGDILKALWRTFGNTFAWAGTLKFIHDCLMLLGPVLLQWLLETLQAPVYNGGKAFGLAFAMFLCATGQTLIVNQYFHILFRISLHIKISLVHTLYKKSLRVTAAVRSGLGVGPVANLQSNDAAKIWNMVPYLHVLWSGPFQILVVLVLLCRVVHVVPAVAGVAVTLLLIPINAAVSKQISKMRREMMKFTDKRVKLVTEVVTGVKAIKLYAWEDPYVQKIMDLRERELALIRRTAYFNITNTVLFMSGPILVALACFGTYSAMGYKLTASIAFPALALFNLLRFPILMLPSQIMNLIQASIGIRRIQSFLDAEEMDQEEILPGGPVAIRIRDGTFTWGAAPPKLGERRPGAPMLKGEEKKVVTAAELLAPGKLPDPVLHDINLDIKTGELLIVVGEVGSGKSSLLAAILGELKPFGPFGAGSHEVRGSVAYTAQDPWIQNLTLKDNVIMGAELDEEKYEHVLDVCALRTDLTVLPGGDLTEIGEKGVNLSGGQKHRVALARAVYQEADVYLLDDPLSAVDVHVGQHLFQECICGQLAGKTRVLVTHQLQYLPMADRIAIMRDGRIMQLGTYDQLIAKGIDFHSFQSDKPKDKAEEGAGAPAAANGSAAPGAAAAANGEVKPSSSSAAAPAAKAAPAPKVAMSREASTVMADKGRLVKKEGRSEGTVKRGVYLAYVGAWGPYFLLPIGMVGFALSERGLQLGQNGWLSSWSNDMNRLEKGLPTLHGTGWYLMIYALLGLVSIVLLLFRSVAMVIGVNNASRNLQARLLSHVIRLPMSFFDSQPTGRLLNRFTKDVESVDNQVGQSVFSFITCIVAVAGSLVVIVVVTPAVILMIIPLAFFYYKVQQAFISTSRETKRLDSLAYSPIFGHFNESLTGLTTIRAFRKQADFDAKNIQLLDNSNRAYWTIQAVNRWLSIRIEMYGNIVVFGAALFVSVLTRKNAGLAGLALTSALTVTGFMNWTVRMVTELEVNMNAVERMLEYEAVETEAPAIIEAHRPPASWPQEGAITVQSLWVRYRPELDPVLRGVSFSIRGKEKVGVCGRTGCGKSTLMMTIYRIVEPTEGRIIIDGVDTGSIGLTDLRQRLALVPQDPVIFSGSIRSNLDPFGEAKDDFKIWRALERAGMHTAVRGMEGGLDAKIIEGGGNLSVGQRQLLCMARALLRNARILILDEATSNVDHANDNEIQKTIREAFVDCTVLTIAHRLNTIIDSDKIVLLDAGNLEEFDTPDNLLKNPEGAFYKLVQGSGGLGKM